MILSPLYVYIVNIKLKYHFSQNYILIEHDFVLENNSVFKRARPMVWISSTLAARTDWLTVFHSASFKIHTLIITVQISQVTTESKLFGFLLLSQVFILSAWLENLEEKRMMIHNRSHFQNTDCVGACGGKP